MKTSFAKAPSKSRKRSSEARSSGGIPRPRRPRRRHPRHRNGERFGGRGDATRDAPRPANISHPRGDGTRRDNSRPGTRTPSSRARRFRGFRGGRREFVSSRPHTRVDGLRRSLSRVGIRHGIHLRRADSERTMAPFRRRNCVKGRFALCATPDSRVVKLPV